MVHKLQEGVCDPPLKIIYSYQAFVKTDDYKLKYLFSAQPSPFFLSFFETGFFLWYHQILFLLQKESSRKHFVVKSIDLWVDLWHQKV